MTFKIVKNKEGQVICYGPNEDYYEPTLGVGEILTVEDDFLAAKMILEITTKANEEIKIAATAKAALLQRLGITADEAALLLG